LDSGACTQQQACSDDASSGTCTSPAIKRDSALCATDTCGGSDFGDDSTACCVECLVNTDCSGATPKCAKAGTAAPWTCVEVGSDDATCLDIDADKPKWDASGNACVACLATADCTGTDVCSTATPNTCVAVGSDDATCAAIDTAKPKWSNGACVAAPTATTTPAPAATTTPAPKTSIDPGTEDSAATATLGVASALAAAAAFARLL
jgi:hypothetical protein